MKGMRRVNGMDEHLDCAVNQRGCIYNKDMCSKSEGVDIITPLLPSP